MFLTPAELRDLTDLEKPSAICNWLRKNGYRFEVAASGWPKVLRAAVEAKLGVTPTPAGPTLRLVKP